MIPLSADPRGLGAGFKEIDMDFETAKAMIDVISTERQRRSDRLRGRDPEFVGDQWLFTDEPFASDMCLMVLVAVWHQVERELVWLAACATKDGKSIGREQYEKNIHRERKLYLRDRGRIIEKLALDEFPEWKSSMEALRLLANCFKHDPTQRPSTNLLKHLSLPLKPSERLVVGYAPLSESSLFRGGLAVYLNLSKDADYCLIAKMFVDSADQFLKSVRQRTRLAQSVPCRVQRIEYPPPHQVDRPW
jgi:hypothetical protein